MNKKEEARSLMEKALCSDREIEAMQGLTPLENLMFAPIADEIGINTDLLWESVGVESARRFVLAVMGICNTVLFEVEKLEALKNA